MYLLILNNFQIAEQKLYPCRALLVLTTSLAQGGLIFGTSSADTFTDVLLSSVLSYSQPLPLQD